MPKRRLEQLDLSRPRARESSVKDSTGSRKANVRTISMFARKTTFSSGCAVAGSVRAPHSFKRGHARYGVGPRNELARPRSRDRH